MLCPGSAGIMAFYRTVVLDKTTYGAWLHLVDFSAIVLKGEKTSATSYFITKTSLLKYTESFTTKNENFEMKILIFSQFCLKHRLLVLVRTTSARRF